MNIIIILAITYAQHVFSIDKENENEYFWKRMAHSEIYFQSEIDFQIANS